MLLQTKCVTSLISLNRPKVQTLLFIEHTVAFGLWSDGLIESLDSATTDRQTSHLFGEK